MASRLPELVGLADLLKLTKPLGGRSPILVYFSEREFKTLLRDAIQVRSRPKSPAMAFIPLGGGMVMDRCDSPPGQTCVGRWTPAGSGRSGGVYFDCRCVVTEPQPPKRPCRMLLNASGRLQCEGECEKTGHSCTLRSWRDPKTGRFVVECACQLPVLQPGG